MSSQTLKRHLFIIGAMKCGTSSLFEYLKEHSDIIPSKYKEPEYFTPNQSNKIDLDSYYDLWPSDANINSYLMEASTGYTKDNYANDVVVKIDNLNSINKFVYLVRDPVIRIESHLNFIKQTTNLKGALDEHSLSISKYYSQIKPYLDTFGADSILVLDFDDLKDRPEFVLNQVFEFLEIKPQFPTSYSVHNKLESLGYLHRVIRSSKALRNIIIKLFPYSFISFVANSLPKNKSVVKKKLTEDEILLIRTSIDSDISKFGKFFNFPIEKWGFEK